MTHKIEYRGAACAVFTNSSTVVEPGRQAVPAEVALYAAWRWLYHCNVLHRPLCTLCLAFRRELVRTSSLRMEVSLPASAAGLPGPERLHLLLLLSCEGVYLEKVIFSPRTVLSGLPGRVRRVVFH